MPSIFGVEVDGQQYGPFANRADAEQFGTEKAAAELGPDRSTEWSVFSELMPDTQPVRGGVR